MRYYEIVMESQQRLRSDVDDLLATLKSQGQDQVSTDAFVSQLSSMGHNVTADALSVFLTNNPFVDTASSTMITFKKDDLRAQ